MLGGVGEKMSSRQNNEFGAVEIETVTGVVTQDLNKPESQTF